jgi:hypothetical protein
MDERAWLCGSSSIKVISMTPAEFKEVTADQFHGALLALWWDARGNWEKAHEVAQDIGNSEGSWVHAYLHRKEGDLGMPDIGIAVQVVSLLQEPSNLNGSLSWRPCWKAVLRPGERSGAINPFRFGRFPAL